VASWDSTRLDVFSIDTTQHGLIQDYFNGHWNGPVHLDFPMGAAAAVGTLAVTAPVTVMADPNPRSKPIPVDEKAKAAD
jgi:hypothetical protein